MSAKSQDELKMDAVKHFFGRCVQQFVSELINSYEKQELSSALLDNFTNEEYEKIKLIASKCNVSVEKTIDKFEKNVVLVKMTKLEAVGLYKEVVLPYTNGWIIYKKLTDIIVVPPNPINELVESIKFN